MSTTNPFDADAIAAIANELFQAGLASLEQGDADGAPAQHSGAPTSTDAASNPVDVLTAADIAATSVPGASSTSTAVSYGELISQAYGSPPTSGGQPSGETTDVAAGASDSTAGTDTLDVDALSVEALDVNYGELDLSDLPTGLLDVTGDAGFVADQLADPPANTDELVADAAGDHPYLRSRYTDAVADVATVFSGEHAVVEPLDDLVAEPKAAHAVSTGLADPITTPGTGAVTEQSDESETEAEVPTGSISDAALAEAAVTVFTPVLSARGGSDPVAGLAADTSSAGFDPEAVRADFPVLRERVNGRELVWLDNGATTQKPQQVIDRISSFYEHENSNVHRTAHTMAGRATDAYEGARDKVRAFINAPDVDDIIWVRGTSEGINLLANTIGEQLVGPGDEVLISWLEHHANIVPWQMLCARKGAKLKVAPVDDSGQVILSEFERLITPATKLVSVTQVSNALGTITPVKEMVRIAHRHEVPVVVDGAQAVLHMPVDVQDIDCDFYVFSGHKMFAPTGIGVVYGRTELLAKMPPWQGGGNMIDEVHFDHTTYQDPPWRFEAGTGSIADAVGLGASIDYLNKIGMANIARYEHDLLGYSTDAITGVPGLTLYGTADNKAGVLSFNIEGHDAVSVGKYLDECGIAVRAGHHCAQPILRRFGVTETVRAALAMYNTRADIDRLVDALHRLVAGTPAQAG